MKHYKDSNGNLYGYPPLGIEVTEISFDEICNLLTQKTNEQLAEMARTQRDQMLDDVSKRYDRYASEMRVGLNTTDSIEALDTYAQALRDITKQEGFPTNIEWPKVPA